MQNNLYRAAKLTEHVRDGLVEQEHSGFVVLKLNNKTIEIGDTYDYPFYLRSCAKPLQAALLIDEKIDNKLDLTSEEIAICCASHAGEDCHREVAKGLLKKTGVHESDIKCGIHKPLAKSVKCDNPTVFHNNCVGKHIMMLTLCKFANYDTDTYLKKEHPLQQKIKKKIYELCEYSADTPVTKDGCGVPIFSMPLRNMLTGYINLFCSEKYSKIREAFLSNPYIIGGEDRLDTLVMQGAQGLVAKVGAEGLCIVVNTDTKEGFIVKILDSDMKTREFVVLNILNKLGWGKYINDCEIKTLHNEVIGTKKITFDMTF